MLRRYPRATHTVAVHRPAPCRLSIDLPISKSGSRSAAIALLLLCSCVLRLGCFCSHARLGGGGGFVRRRPIRGTSEDCLQQIELRGGRLRFLRGGHCLRSPFAVTRGALFARRM